MTSRMTPRPDRRLLLTLGLLSLAGGIPSCASVSVAPGHAAVLMTSDGTMSVLGEGTSALPSGSLADDFDLRQQGQTSTFKAITADAVPVLVGDPVVSYHVVASELVAADRALSPADQCTLIGVVVEASVASVLASYRWDQLDTRNIREAQERIAALASMRLRPYHIALTTIELKGISPRLPGFAKEVAQTSVWEQRSAEAKTRIELARQKADRLRQEASGARSAYQAIEPTLSAAVLADQEAKEWKRLLTSPATTVHVTTNASILLEESP